MLGSILEYHDRTSYSRGRLSGGYLDWSTQPSVYKTYKDGEEIPLPRDLSFPEVSFHELLRGLCPPADGEIADLRQLATLLVLTCGVTGRAKYTGGEFFYRSTPSAGALYPCEIYLECRNIRGLAPGLYHYNLPNHALVKLKPLKGEAGGRPQLNVFITCIFFRSSWKYGERSYRYVLLDTGHVLENLLLASEALGLGYEVYWDFSDEKVNDFLGLDPKKESCLVVVGVGGQGDARGLGFPLDETKGGIISIAQPIAPREHVPPLVWEMHALTCAFGPSPLEKKRVSWDLGPRGQVFVEVNEVFSRSGSMRYTDALWARRSKRSFSLKGISKENFKALMSALRLPPRCFGTWEMKDVVGCGFLVGKVEGMEPGFYLCDPHYKGLWLSKSGDLMGSMAHAALDQGWLGQASLHLLVLANLDAIEKAMGPRAYRYGMIIGGMVGQRTYLGATALGLGACGVGAFYDDEARTLLGLNETSRLLYLVAVGSLKG